ncbi:ADP-ribosylglycohydrolase family protein [Streptacidiphilus sp. N1-10]|uniref:ADP-ribosylglycohydrolase family protein n=1 Tax=Streptacidiphilus jeojiensis TaxID=3229225 RepID=A0ABV6XWL0_9ACTN
MTDQRRLDRIQGCLLGGAIGDALGWPVEFQRLDRILDDHGPDGVTRLVLRADSGLAEVTDDTQMTLFTAEGLLLAEGRLGGDTGSESVVAAVHAAYQRWFLTQRLSGPTGTLDAEEGSLLREPWLYASRAPGNACISGLVENPQLPRIMTTGQVGVVNPDSKGCGTVMRSAPFGLLGLGPEQAFRLAADCAQLTHGHPTGQLAAGAFAALVQRLVDGVDPGEAVRRTIAQTAAWPDAHPGATETVTALERAVRLAESGAPGFDLVEQVGLGWIAEECLAIAVHCLLAAAPGPDATSADLRRALTLSVTHSGDSDSTGAVCGNLLGAAHGLAALPEDWAVQVEGRATVLATGAALHLRSAAVSGS